MRFFEKALKANVMSTKILIRANVSKDILHAAYKIATDFEDRYSAYKKESFLSQINAKASKESIRCQERDMILFKRCMEASALTEGAFDITIGSLSHGAYHFGFLNQQLASTQEISAKQKFVNSQLFDIQEKSVSFKKNGVRIDLGGIGKGYVAKLIVAFLKKSGASKALVDVGGETVSFGKSYTIAIKDPFSEGNIGFIKTSKEAISISTSGDYERFIDSPTNNHILNTDTGKSSNLYSSITILQNGFDIDMLDAFATALFNKDVQYIQEFCKKRNIGLIIIDKDSNMIFNNISSLRISSIELLCT
ncbi:FAD:protein FMN transferase [Sulfurimonas sp. SAG-AH-194-L11]|nr:FAD:protein FMN transferase [Sulfurimonas sp. SAG-AH-194-L11]MDF1877722.1 FAD:protein FMN transferase [Sulfurimonas sp. SAG-AH-194-L11]